MGGSSEREEAKSVHLDDCYAWREEAMYAVQCVRVIGIKAYTSSPECSRQGRYIPSLESGRTLTRSRSSDIGEIR